MKRTSVVIAIASILFLAGCSTAPSSSSGPADEAAAGSSSEATPSFASAPATEEAEDIGNLAFGDAATYPDDISISVSAPAPFTPGEYASGATQAANVVFSFTITNGSAENFEPYTYAQVSSGGVEGESIFDSGNPVGELTGGPTAVILPGGTVTWMQAFSVADANALTLQVSPNFEYEDAIFTNVQ